MDLFPAFLLFAHLFQQVNSAPKSYEGYQLYRVEMKSEKEIKLLHSLWVNPEDTGMELDFWQPPSKVGRDCDVLVSPAEREKFVNFLHSQNMEWKVVINNMEEKIKEEREEGEEEEAKGREERRRRRSTDPPAFSLTRYNLYSEIQEHLYRLQEKHPELVTVRTIGRTHEGRNITLIKIGLDNGSKKKKPGIWIDGGIHAREWITPATALYFIHKLVNKSNKATYELVSTLDWFILPVMNPDGYQYTHTADRMWRKNRSPSKCRLHFGNYERCCPGVDLNRNFKYHHCGQGSSEHPCSEIYCGEKPGSEPETKAVMNFIKKNKKNIKAFITMHSYSQMWLYPFGYEKNRYPKNKQELKNVAEKALRELWSPYGTEYEYGTAADVLYEAAGGSDDWAKARAKIQFVYLLELRPCSHCDKIGFYLSPRKIIPTAKETWMGVKVVAKEIIAQLKQVPNSKQTVDKTKKLPMCRDKYSARTCKRMSDHGRCDRSRVIQKKCKRSCLRCPQH